MTTELVEMTEQISVHIHNEMATIRHFMEMKMFIEKHFDELNLSQLLHCIRKKGVEKDFNACMALLNKHLGLSKGKIPFDLDLQDYVYADKIMGALRRE